MKFGYLPDWTLRMVINEAPEILLAKVWLIVALGSNRGEKLLASYNFLKDRLPKTVRWTGSGIRFEGRDIPEAIEKGSIFVPFSAAYVVDANAPDLLKPYNLTSESETFESTLPTRLAEDILKPGVHHISRTDVV